MMTASRSLCACVLLVASALFATGCEDEKSCDSTDDCANRQVCIDGTCGDDDGRDTGNGDTGHSDAGEDAPDANDSGGGDVGNDSGDTADDSSDAVVVPCGNGSLDEGESCDIAIPAGEPGACPLSCDDGDPCTTDALVGTECNAECEASVDVAVGADDGCCPDGADHDADGDCVPDCGDGVLGAHESCDSAIPAGEEGACPDTCDDSDPCTGDAMTGSRTTCDVLCSNTPFSVCGDGDLCCPPGCTDSNDLDCSGTCGNGSVEAPEVCDGSEFGGADCTDFGYVDAAGLRCEAGCASVSTDFCQAVCGNGTVEPGESCDDGSGGSVGEGACLAGCTATQSCGDSICNGDEDSASCAADCGNQCGDGAISGPELCDGAELDGNDCTDFGYVAATGLACAAGCLSFDDSGCDNECGNGIAEPGESCDDGGDNGTGEGFCLVDCQSTQSCGDVACNGTETSATCPADCGTVCGDGAITGSEPCDGALLGGRTCIDEGYTDGAGLACDATCTGFNTAGCTSDCGDGNTEPGESCDDGGDNGTGEGFCLADCSGTQSCGDTVCDGSESSSTCPGDCGTICGDLVANGAELCDGDDLNGNDCTGRGYVGAAGLACNGGCDGFITDGCASDCGNGTTEPGESCDDGGDNGTGDGFCLAGCSGTQACGDGACNGTEDNISCLADCAAGVTCSDNVAQGAEACDGTDLKGNDCTDYGYINPAGLACNGGCTDFVTAGCTSDCGNGTAEPGESCDDGGDNGTGDGFCLSSCAGTQSCGDSVCNGTERTATCPADCGTQCGDTVANGAEACDGDDLLGRDCTDEGYVAAAGLACNSGCTGFNTSGCTADCGNGTQEPGESCDDGAAQGEGSCLDDCSGTQSCGDAACNGTEDTTNCPADCGTQCGDTVANGAEACDGDDLLGRDCTDEGYVAADGLACNAGCTGFDTSGCAADCGNGTQEPGESCDDGATQGEGSCLNDCSGTQSCGDNSCDGDETSVTCSADCGDVCGDGAITGSEICDGADLAGADCTDEGYVAPGGLACTGGTNGCESYDTSGCSASCGNDTQEPGESCDDGNNVTDDCAYGPTSCTVCAAGCVNGPGVPHFCGDGVTDGGDGENCDDGTANSAAGPCGLDCQPVGGCADTWVLTYAISGLFDITNTTGGYGDFNNIAVGPGTITLRVPDNAGAPAAAGSVQVLEYSIVQLFQTHAEPPLSSITIDTDVTATAGKPCADAPFDFCGGSQPSPCSAGETCDSVSGFCIPSAGPNPFECGHATGSMDAGVISFADCPTNGGGNDWTPSDPGPGAGCITDYSSYGEIDCEGSGFSTCDAGNLSSGCNVQSISWDQPMGNITLSGGSDGVSNIAMARTPVPNDAPSSTFITWSGTLTASSLEATPDCLCP